MIIIFIRTLVLALVVIITVRLMGKRQIGELQPFEFVVAIMISEVASIPMQDSAIPLIGGLTPIFGLVGFQLLLSYCSQKSAFLRRLICGTPVVIIENGCIKIENLKKEIYSLSDLMEQLRGNGYDDISQIHTAILETNGKLSVIPKSLFKPTTSEMLDDLQTNILLYQPNENITPISGMPEGYAKILIQDGKLNHKNLSLTGKTSSWLENQFLKHNITSMSEIFYASLSTDDRLHWQLKDDAHKKYIKDGKI